MFTIDFTKPWLYRDIIYFNQGNLSTNNTLRCKLITGGSDDFTGGSIACTFTTKDSVEINGFGKLVDAKNGIIDIVFPSNSLVVGNNKLEVLVNRADGGVAQSPPVTYDIWQGLTTGNGIEAETNYPILIELINSTNEASNKANLALNKANSMITDITDAIDNAYRSANDADIATSKAYSKIEEVENAKVGMINKVDTEIANMKTQVNTSTNTMTSKVDMKIADVDSAIASGTKDLEVKESRRDMDGVEHDTLKLRLESDLKKGKVIEETKEGTYLSFNDTVGGIVSDIEVFGNTVQDASNLVNIRSSCIPNGDGTFKMSILSVGENLFNKFKQDSGSSNNYFDSGFNEYVSSTRKGLEGFYAIINVNGGSAYVNFDKEGSVDVGYRYSDLIPSDFTSAVAGVSLIGAGYRDNTNKSKYLIITFRTLSEGVVAKIKNVDVKITTVATPYTPYQETRCDIKLPCQLEKWDRLYFDKDENAWCVDKGTKKKFVEEFKIIQGATANGLTNYHLEDLKAMNTGRVDDIICNKLIYNSSSVVKISKYPNGTEAVMRLNSSEFDTLQKVLDWSKSNQVYVLLYSDTPQKIVLPQSEQVKLNSFANKTHIYTISGDVDATVKATVSKSLASTVQANTNEINILNDKIEDIQGLKESQDFAYETDKGYLICKDTQNGVVKDLKIYGKSLFNIIDYSKVLKTGVKEGNVIKGNVGGYSRIFEQDISNYSGNFITLNFETVGDGRVRIEDYSGKPIFDKSSQSGTFGVMIPSNTKCKLILQSSSLGGEIKFINFMCFIGDITENTPSYFEGIASVGNGNEIEVLSCNKNLVIECVKGFTIGGNEGSLLKKSESTTYNHIKAIAPKGEFYYKSKGTQYYVFFTDENLKILKIQKTGLAVLNNDVNASYIFTNIDSTLNYMDLTVSYDKYYTVNNIEPKLDKKTILFKDTDNSWKPITNLRGIDESNCDIIENESIKVKTIESTINGLENIIIADDTLPNTTMFAIQNYFTNNLIGLQGVGICNSLPYKNIYSKDEVGIFATSSNGTVYIRVNKKSLESFKNEIKLNNIVFITTLNKEKVYEINPIFPSSYENETMISFGSGAIATHASWKITSSLPNFVKELSKQVRQLQDQVYKTNVANFTVALNTLDTKLRLDRLEAPQQ